ncbi:MAG: hypothetical protein LBB79_06720 [Prevotellaceae bacterium]|jgi:hypothetical protein|nr:hypothetical protein [Prevotellaceae bacterium]
MQQTTNRKQVIIILGLIMAAAALLLFLGRSLLVSATDFGFADANKVRSITFSDGEQQVKLRKRNGIWYIDGDKVAQQERIVDALFALQMLQVKYPLPVEYAEAYRQAKGAALHVSISDWLGKIRSYSIGMVDTMPVGAVSAEKPYVVEVSGNGELDIFSLMDANPLFWYKTTVINMLPSQIAAISVEDLGKPERSLKLSLDTLGQAQVTALYSGRIFRNLDSARVRRYLSYYHDVNFERYTTGLSAEDFDAIVMTSLAYIFTIEGRDGATRTVKLFYMPVGDALDAFGRPTKTDLNRCYLQQDDDPNLAIALWVDFDLLIKDVNFFLTK